MTWTQGLWAVDGNTLPASLWRQQLESATLRGQGIMYPTDLKVSALGTPGAAVQIAGGSCVVAGKEATLQGSYYGQNNGSDTVSVSPTGGQARNDLIIARVEDPTVPGSAWGWDPGTDQLIYCRNISNVSAGTKEPPAGQSAIPLALIAIPPSTSAITNGMITDLRQLLNPLRLRQLVITPFGASDQLQYNQATWKTWPSGQSWSIDVPSWAKKMRFLYQIGQLLVNCGSGAGPICSIRMQLAGSINSQATFLNASSSSGNVYRSTGILGDNVDVSAHAGTTITVVPQGIGQGSASGYFQIDTYSTLAFDYEFYEVPI